MTNKPWTPEREAAMLAKAEKGLKASEIGPAAPNPLRKAGRPSLSPEGGTSRALNTRIPSDLHGKVVAFARKTGRSVSDLTRDALTAFMTDDTPPSAPDTSATTQARARRGAAGGTDAKPNQATKRARQPKTAHGR